jgi:hemin uptake protein HemP
MNLNPKVSGSGPYQPAQVDAPAGHQSPPSSARVLRLPSDTLFSGAQEIEIEHRGTVYRLRQTALGKLILTK